MKATISKKSIPLFRNMRVRFQLEGDINISPYIAQQKVNQFLIMNLPNLIMSDEPECLLTQEGIFWRVPVVLTNPKDGIIGKVGEILVDANTGIIELQNSTPLEEIERNAESIIKQETSETRD